MMISEIPVKEQPREKAKEYGLQSLSNRELLALMIRNGVNGRNVMEVADELLRICNGVGGLNGLTMQELKRIRGIGEAKALEILACFEINKRLSYECVKTQTAIDSPEALYDWLKNEIGHGKQETFIAIFLNHANCIIGHQILFVGTVNRSIVSPRELFHEALSRSAVNVIVAHNHPSGNLTPSNADIRMTQQLIEAGRIVGITVLDHIIVSRTSCLSLAREGLFAQSQSKGVL